MVDNPEKGSIQSRDSTSSVATRGELNAFLTDLKKHQATVGSGRLIFALDATASREPMWEMACQLQGQMFDEVKTIGGLSVQLLYYRGLDECRASKWISRPEHLSGLMEKIQCRMGHTQIKRVLVHAQKETKLLPVSALVFVGDAMEENPDELGHEAGELGRLGVRAFIFQEGRDPQVERVFREVARLSKGAYGRFDAGAARQLAELLRAVAAFATGGMAALAARKDEGAIKLLGQMR